MFAAVSVRASLKTLFHGRHSSSYSRYCEIAAISKRISQDRFSDGNRILNSLKLSGNGVGIKLFNCGFHSSPQCCTSESDVGVKTHAPALFSHLEDDYFSELGPVEKEVDENVIVKMLTEKPVISLKTKGNKKKKTKKQELASDSISKPKLLTEKPEVSWKVNGKKKTEANASSPAKDATDSKVSFSKPTKSSSQVQDQKSKSQKKISPSSEPENETISKGSATSNTLSSVLVIRIGNLNSKTADSLIHSMCFSIGPLEGLTRVNEDTVDVLFRLKDLKEADSILEELNDATVDNSQWTAEIVLEAEEASKNQMGMRITSCLEDLDKQLLMQRILGKDLEVLLHSVMHLENHPMARGRD
ncbi:sucrose-phosphatase-like protein [Arabidopsis thaliana]|jgi:hypothetical protein|uniref:At3g62620 n=3 Tax=Arabidopsis thaliana TaxID=3702 RepID=Q29Q18_ARATH|nr:sucrose-phosphatase-like protein [Arabidopsis thaliana]ABD59076.1 At3g62620 [Arabidopsis thaliana]AEE80370.1 sucrose-phosphatase-like protein [Arabidopsis thaliana]|eukprot:NP_191821.2 sucrose-phosphatase-like protein [Arabidopsis thaliana]